MRTQIIMLAGLFAMVPLNGCASMVNGTTDDVKFNSVPDRVDVRVLNSSGKEVFRGTTPTTAHLARGAGYFRPAKYTATFTMPGCRPVERTINTGISGWYLAGNLCFGFFGGMIGWLVVDPLTGAMWTLEGDCVAELKPSVSSSATDASNLTVVSLDSVPDHLKSHLRRVN